MRRDPEPKDKQELIPFPPNSPQTFRNFIKSNGSLYALTSAKEFASDKEISYQSLFLYGGQGFGKTHLLKAIQNDSLLKSLYLKGEETVSSSFAPSFSWENLLSQLDKIDLLLIDDIDEISGDLNAQENLHHTFNKMKQNGGRIAFASRNSPESIKETEDFILSRFKSGMIVRLDPMDDKATENLLYKLAKDINLEITEPVVHFLMLRITRDYTSISKTISAIDQTSYSLKQRVTIPLVKKALGI